MGVNCVKELLQFLGGQDSIREVWFEFIKGQFAIICEQKNPKTPKPISNHINAFKKGSIFHTAAEVSISNAAKTSLIESTYRLFWSFKRDLLKWCRLLLSHSAETGLIWRPELMIVPLMVFFSVCWWLCMRKMKRKGPQKPIIVNAIGFLQHLCHLKANSAVVLYVI